MEKIYITKYALTGGIKEIEANITTYSTSGGKGTEYAREPNSYGSFIRRFEPVNDDLPVYNMDGVP